MPALLLMVAIIEFAAWWAIDPGRAWPSAVAVLFAACPGMLTLASLIGVGAARNRLLRHGVLSLGPHALAALARATHIVFDKTGTLTQGRPAVRAVRPFGGIDAREALALAAGLESHSVHPLAQAIRAAAHGSATPARHVDYADGQGVEGEVDGTRYRVGSASFVAALVGRRMPVAPNAEGSAVWLGKDGAWLARFDIVDGLRAEAPEVVRRFEAAGKTVVLLSGDESRAAQALAARLGIRLAAGGQLPTQKCDFVRELQAQGAIVAMVGNGIGDAAVLRCADVSFAMGSDAVLAQQHVDGVLPADSLLPLVDAHDTARRTRSIIHQNLAWSGVYKLVAIPLAATGMLSPWEAGVGMAACAALAVLNALRLKR